MAEWIENLSVARAPEHVLHGHNYFRATRHRAFNHRIGFVSHQRDAHAGAAKCLRCLAGAALFRSKLVADEELVAVQDHLSVHQTLSIRRHHVMAFPGAENFFVEFQRRHAIAHTQMRNQLIFTIHFSVTSKQLLIRYASTRADELTLADARSFTTKRGTTCEAAPTPRTV